MPFMNWLNFQFAEETICCPEHQFHLCTHIFKNNTWYKVIFRQAILHWANDCQVEMQTEKMIMSLCKAYNLCDIPTHIEPKGNVNNDRNVVEDTHLQWTITRVWGQLHLSYSFQQSFYKSPSINNGIIWNELEGKRSVMRP